MLYLLHSSHPIGGKGRNSALHYVGFCEEENLWKRMHAHLTGTSKVPIIEAFKSTGGTLYLVRVWPNGGRALERHLKKTGHFNRHCPICQKWLPEERALSIEVASTLLPTFDGRHSPKPMLEALTTALSGTDASKDGAFVQTVIQGPSSWSGSVVGVSLASPGGRVSRVAALMNGPAVRYVGTKQPWSDGGKTPVTARDRGSHAKRPSEGRDQTAPSDQLTLGLIDEEGFQT